MKIGFYLAATVCVLVASGAAAAGLSKSDQADIIDSVSRAWTMPSNLYGVLGTLALDSQYPSVRLAAVAAFGAQSPCQAKSSSGARQDISDCVGPTKDSSSNSAIMGLSDVAENSNDPAVTEKAVAILANTLRWNRDNEHGTIYGDAGGQIDFKGYAQAELTAHELGKIYFSIKNGKPSAANQKLEREIVQTLQGSANDEAPGIRQTVNSILSLIMADGNGAQ